MIIIVTDEKDSAKLIEKTKNRKLVYVSDELSAVNIDNAYEAKQFLPTAGIMAPLLNHGEEDEYKQNYLHYLSDPRVRHMLVMYLYMSIDTPVFFICSKAEKDLKYLKFIREYIIDYLGIPKKYCIKYKDFKKNIDMDKKTAELISKLMISTKKKAQEAIGVYDIGEEQG